MSSYNQGIPVVVFVEFFDNSDPANPELMDPTESVTLVVSPLGQYPITYTWTPDTPDPSGTIEHLGVGSFQAALSSWGWQGQVGYKWTGKGAGGPQGPGWTAFTINSPPQ